MVYEQINALFDEFNTHLFENILGNKISPCIITLNRKNKSYSGNMVDHFISLDDVGAKSELSLNPDYFGVRPRLELLQSMVHEMMHLYKQEHGTVTKPGTHDEQFLDFMNAIGLMPSSNGRHDGKSIGGKNFFNYPLPGGEFLSICNGLVDKKLLPNWFVVATPPNVSIDSIIKNLYELKELLGDEVDPYLLEVPLLIKNNIDVQALLSCLTVDHKTNRVELDRAKASVLADRQIEENKRTIEAAEGRQFEPTESKELKFSSTFQNNDLPNFSNRGLENNYTQQNDESIDSEIIHTKLDGAVQDENISDNFLVEDENPEFVGIDNNDAAAKFLKQFDSKPKSETRTENLVDTNLQHLDKKLDASLPRVVQSADEIASILGLKSASLEKPAEKKKTRYKYTCPCDNIIWGGLSMSIICGKCQLHYKCENVESEKDVIKG